MVGYSTQSRSQAGLERSLNDYLTASNSHLNTVLRRTLDSLKGTTVTGNNLVLTIDSKAQQAALDALDENCGAAVALEPVDRPRARDGLVAVLRPEPRRAALRRDRPAGAERELLAGARRSSTARPPGLYTPGSTFKVVTAAAALDTGRFTPDSSFVDPGYCTEYGKKVSNFADQNGPEVFGRVSFTTALQHSINAVFCEIGKKIGPLTILDYARGSASTTTRRWRRRRASARRAGCTTTGGCSGRATRTRSTPDGSPSARSGCR